MLRYGREIIRFLCGFCLLVLMAGGGIVQAAGEAPVIRVGCYDLKSFVRQTASGEYEGYGVDYLDMIAEYTGWKYQLVVASNDDLLQQLQQGSIDFLMPVEYTEERAQKYVFPRYPLGEQITGLYVRQDYADIFFDDFSRFQGLRIGSVRNTFPSLAMRRYARDNHFSYEDIAYPDIQSLQRALDDGEVDGVSRSGLGDIPADNRLVGIAEIEPFYIVSSRSVQSRYGDELERALRLIQYEHPEFAETLCEKYSLPRRAGDEVQLTRDEAAYVQSHPVITVMSFRDRYPVAYAEGNSGQLSGILRELFEAAAHKTGLEFTYAAVPDHALLIDQLRKGKTDIALGAVMSENNRKDVSLVLSKSLMKNILAIAGQRGTSFDDKAHYTVAIPEESTGTISHVKLHHPEYTIITCPSTAECLRAVRDGRADGAVQNSNVLSALLQHPEFNDLQIWHTFADEGGADYCVAALSNVDPRLMSILNKGIRSLDKNEVQAIISRNMGNQSYEMTWRDVIAKYRVSAALLAVLVLLIILGGSFLLHTKRRHFQALKQHNRALLQANHLANRAMDESRRANDAKTKFLSRMSHDIRTPLNGVIGMAALAKEVNTNVQVAGYLDKISVSGHFLMQLVNDILTISKIDAGREELHPEPYPEDEFLTYIHGVILPLCVAKHIEFRAELSNIRRAILVDKLKYNQIFFNLLSNAVKFTPAGGHICISESHQEIGNRILLKIVVQDDGIGIPAEFQKRLFSPFAQAQQPDMTENQGSGLGLAITHRLVRLMGGRIEVQSTLGKGTSFQVYLDVPMAEAPTAAPQPRIIREELLDGRLFLVAEDNEINGEILLQLLQRKGAKVIWARNGLEAVRCFQETTEFSLAAVLMDVRMPVMDGLQAAREIRALPRADAAAVPILAVTANAYQEDAEACIAAGMDGHIAKPVDIQELLQVLSEQVGRSRGR